MGVCVYKYVQGVYGRLEPLGIFSNQSISSVIVIRGKDLYTPR